MEPASYELMNALRTLLEIGKYSDLKIVCGQKTYAVHRAIICSRSGFFDGACSNPFREAETGTINLSEDDAEAVDHMVHYFYHLDYLSSPRARSRGTSLISAPTSPIAGELPMSPMSPMSPGSRFSRPKKLNLAMVEDPLLATAASNIPSSTFVAPQSPLTPPLSASLSGSFSVKAPPEDAYTEDVEVDMYDAISIPDQEPNRSHAHLLVHAKVYAIAEKYGIRGLKALAQKKFAAQMAYHWESVEFPEAIQEAYESTLDSDRGLRDIVIQTFRAYPELAQRRDVEAVVKETPGLAWELFRVGWGLPISS